jgi:hypothetical protein
MHRTEVQATQYRVATILVELVVYMACHEKLGGGIMSCLPRNTPKKHKINNGISPRTSFPLREAANQANRRRK